MRSVLRFASALAAVASASSPAYAYDFVEERGGWMIVATDDGCMVSMDFEGPGETTFSLHQEADGGRVLATVQNLNWSAKAGEVYQVGIYADGYGYKGPGAGFTAHGKRGFVTRVGTDFIDMFAKGSTLYVKLEETEIDRLSLDGSAVAVESMKRCMRGVIAEFAAEERERKRFEHLPKDPFATPPPPPGEPTPPIPIDLMGWATATQANYPSVALRQNASGTVNMRLTVSPYGRVSACTVIGSSGHSSLDDAACRTAHRYACFKPATDANGNPVQGSTTQAVRYSLPE